MFARIILILILLFSVASGESRVASANNLDLLRNSFDLKRKNTLSPILADYTKKLENLEFLMLKNNDRAGLQTVRAEKKRIAFQISKLEAVTKTEPATKEPVKPKATRTPKTHISNVQGIAGNPDFSRNNIYTFNLPDTGPASKLTFYASGRKSTDSYGKVWLITPDHQRHRIYKWSPRDFNKTFSEASSYKKLSPVTCDLSKLMTKPGLYKIEFGYTDGIDALGIMRVEITS